MKHEFRNITESEAKYLSRRYKIPVAQAKEWFGVDITICNVPYIETISLRDQYATETKNIGEHGVCGDVRAESLKRHD